MERRNDINKENDPNVILKEWCHEYLKDFRVSIQMVLKEIQQQIPRGKFLSHLDLKSLEDNLYQQLKDQILIFLKMEFDKRDYPEIQHMTLGQQACEHLQAFTIEHDKRPLAFLRNKYPILGPKLGLIKNNFIQNTRRILERTTNNYPILNGFFSDQPKSDEIVLHQIKLGHSDPHKLGEQVAILEFSHSDQPEKCIGRIVYKPTSVMPDALITGDTLSLGEIYEKKGIPFRLPKSFIELLNQHLEEKKQLPTYMICPLSDNDGAFGFIEFLNQVPNSHLDVDKYLDDEIANTFKSQKQLYNQRVQIPRLYQKKLEEDYAKLKQQATKPSKSEGKDHIDSTESVEMQQTINNPKSPAELAPLISTVRKEEEDTWTGPTKEIEEKSNTPNTPAKSGPTISAVPKEEEGGIGMIEVEEASVPSKEREEKTTLTATKTFEGSSMEQIDQPTNTQTKKIENDCVFQSPEDFNLYSLKCGMFAFIAILLRITDLQNENMIMHQLQAYFIDLECAFQHRCDSMAEIHMLSVAFGALSTKSTSVHSYRVLAGNEVVEVTMDLPEKNRAYIEKNGELIPVTPDVDIFIEGFKLAKEIISKKSEFFLKWLFSPAVKELSVRTLPFSTDDLTKMKEKFQVQMNEKDWDQLFMKYYENLINKWLSELRSEESNVSPPLCEAFKPEHTKLQFQSDSVPVFFAKVFGQQLLDYRGKEIMFSWSEIKKSKHFHVQDNFLKQVVRMKSKDEELIEKAEKKYGMNTFFLKRSFDLVYDTIMRVIQNSYQSDMEKHIEMISNLMQQDTDVEHLIASLKILETETSQMLQTKE